MRNHSLDNSAYHKDQISKCDRVIAEYQDKIDCNKRAIREILTNWFGCISNTVINSYYDGMLTDSEFLDHLQYRGKDYSANVKKNNLLLALSLQMIRLRDNRNGLRALKNERSFHRSKMVTGV